MERKYLPTLADLIDRLSICQLKEVFIPEHKTEYAREIQDIIHDLDVVLRDNQGCIDGEAIRAIVVLAQMNLHIWSNESNIRNGITEGNNLELTHGLNGIRTTAKNKIQDKINGRKDWKVDCCAENLKESLKDWEVSW
jgi:hypothetical protein